MRKKYTQAELNKALDWVEEGCSYSEVANEMGLNKSILPREMRKRKNSKGNEHIEQYRKSLVEEIYKEFNEYKK